MLNDAQKKQIDETLKPLLTLPGDKDNFIKAVQAIRKALTIKTDHSHLLIIDYLKHPEKHFQELEKLKEETTTQGEVQRYLISWLNTRIETSSKALGLTQSETHWSPAHTARTLLAPQQINQPFKSLADTEIYKEYAFDLALDKNYQAVISHENKSVKLHILINNENETHHLERDLNDQHIESLKTRSPMFRSKLERDQFFYALLKNYQQPAEEAAALATLHHLQHHNIIPPQSIDKYIASNNQQTTIHLPKPLCQLLTSNTYVAMLEQKTITFDDICNITESEADRLTHPAALKLIQENHARFTDLLAMPDEKFGLLTITELHHAYATDSNFKEFFETLAPTTAQKLYDVLNSSSCKRYFLSCDTRTRESFIDMLESDSCRILFDERFIEFTSNPHINITDIRLFAEEVYKQPALFSFIYDALNSKQIDANELNGCTDLSEAAARAVALHIIALYTNNPLTTNGKKDNARRVSSLINQISAISNIDQTAFRERVFELAINVIAEDIKSATASSAPHIHQHYQTYLNIIQSTCQLPAANRWEATLAALIKFAEKQSPGNNQLNNDIVKTNRTANTSNRFSFFASQHAKRSREDMTAFKETIVKLKNLTPMTAEPSLELAAYQRLPIA